MSGVLVFVKEVGVLCCGEGGCVKCRGRGGFGERERERERERAREGVLLCCLVPLLVYYFSFVVFSTL